MHDGQGAPSLAAQAERLGARADRAAVRDVAPASSRPRFAALAAYLSAAALAFAGSTALGRSPFVCDGWMGARGPASWLLSLGLGLPLGATTIAWTRILVRRWPRAHALHLALRPTVHGSDGWSLLVVAAASAAGEELLFRGLLVPIVGVAASALLFGTLHQVRGPARWIWVAWATIMGLLFGLVFAVTGSLVGPLVAHATINHSNLRFLRDHDLAARPRVLGGLLRR